MTTVLDGQTRIRNDVVDDRVLRNLVEGSSHDALKWLDRRVVCKFDCLYPTPSRSLSVFYCVHIYDEKENYVLMFTLIHKAFHMRC